MIRRLGLFTGIILLTTLLAAAQEDYAMVISGSDNGLFEVACSDCFSNIVTQSDVQTVDNVKTGLNSYGSEFIGIGNEGLSAAITVSDLNLRDLPENGIMITNTVAPIVLKDITVESQRVRDQSFLPVGIGMQNVKNVSMENCTALGGALFRIANSQNIHMKNNTARDVYFEGVKDSAIENCTSDSITIKGILSPFYLNRLNDVKNDSLLSLLDDKMVGSQRCLVKDCNRVKEINVFDAEDCNVENCSVENIGLWMMNANNVTFRNSTVTNATLSIDWSKKINFENTTLINSEISLGGSVPEDYAIAFRNSTVDGKPIYYYENQRDLKLENLNAGHIWLVNCSGSVINNVDALGIFVISSDEVTVKNSQVDGAGVNLAFSKDCVISNNILTNEKSKDGILQYAVCNNNTASSNVLV